MIETVENRQLVSWKSLRMLLIWICAMLIFYGIVVNKGGRRILAPSLHPQGSMGPVFFSFLKKAYGYCLRPKVPHTHQRVKNSTRSVNNSCFNGSILDFEQCHMFTRNQNNMETW